MNFDDYFAKRNELTLRVLSAAPDIIEISADRRFVAVGSLCLFAAAGLHVWASHTLIDPGYFARTSMFLAFMLIAGVGLLVVSGAASAWSTHSRFRAREVLHERTLARLINADRTIALKLATKEIEAI